MVTVGKDTGIKQGDPLQDYDWGRKDDGRQVDKSNDARIKILEEEVLKLQQEKLLWQRQANPPETLLVKSLNTLTQDSIDIKIVMSGIKRGEVATKTKIVNACIQRPNRSPDSDDSLGEYSNGGGVYPLGRGHDSGSNNGGDGDDPEGDEDGQQIANKISGRPDDRGREYILVRSSNIIIQTFGGKNLNSHPICALKPFEPSYLQSRCRRGKIIGDIEGNRGIWSYKICQL